MAHADRAAIADLKQRGVVVSICTGRMYSGSRAIARELGIDGPIGCIDGAHIVRVADDRSLDARYIDAGAAEALLGVAADHDLISFVFAEDQIFHDPAGEPYLAYVRTWSERSSAVEDVLSGRRWRSSGALAAFVGLGTEDKIARASAALACTSLSAVSWPVLRDGYAGMWGLLVRSSDVTKATALEWIARHHDVTLADVVAVGDWVNDVPMLRAAGRSFATAHAPDEVKQSATDVLEAPRSGGAVAEAAARAGLL